MEFNSLDAQREACEAYVASQKREGWLLVPDHYDDGGFSGGTLERPALKRLLADIEAGRVDSLALDPQAMDDDSAELLIREALTHRSRLIITRGNQPLAELGGLVASLR